MNSESPWKLRSWMLKIHLRHAIAWLLALIGGPIAAAACVFPLIGPLSVLLPWALWCLPPVFLFQFLLGMDVFRNEFFLPQSGFEGFLAIGIWVAICWILAAGSSLWRISATLRHANSVGQSLEGLR